MVGKNKFYSLFNFFLIIIPLFNLPIIILNLSIFFISLIISSFIVYDCNQDHYGVGL